jgi:hypothetical protein
MNLHPMRKLRLLLLPRIYKIFPEIFLTTLGGKKNISSITKIAKNVAITIAYNNL